MKESAQIALTYVRAHAAELGIADDAFEDREFHVHVPAGAIPKDGPSAGVTMTTAFASLLTGRPVRHTVGMTGEVTLQGRVLPIGGLKQKVLAAHAAGLTDVVLPERNRGDLDDVPADVREAMAFHPAMTDRRGAAGRPRARALHGRRPGALGEPPPPRPAALAGRAAGWEDAAMAALPPGPRLPAYLQTALLVLRPEATLRRWRRRYGDVFTARSLVSGRIVFLADPAATKDVFTGDHDILRAGEANAFLEPVLGPRSVLLLDGREHLRQRRLLLPPFHGERMRAYESIMREAADRRPGRLARRAALRAAAADAGDHARRHRPGRLRPARRRPRGRRAARSGCGGCSSRCATGCGCWSSRSRAGSWAGPGTTAPSRSGCRPSTTCCSSSSPGARADPGLAEREDICALLLQATDADGEPMSDLEVRDELMTLLVAGHETTATALAWAFERLLRTPGVLDEVRRSIDADDDGYLDATVKEVLRLRPVVPNVARVLKADYRVGSFTLPAGAVVAPSIVLTHGREDLYPAARELRPERFLGEGAPDTYTWLPFGGGRRRCIGAAFAQTEIRVVLRTVLERTTLEAVGRRGERTKRNGVTLVPGRGARVRQRHEPRPPAAATARRARERRTPAATG